MTMSNDGPRRSGSPKCDGREMTSPTDDRGQQEDPARRELRYEQRRYPDTPYLAEPVPRAAHFAPAWTCRCTRPDGRPVLRTRRHTQGPWECLGADVVEAWRQAHPDATARPGIMRALAWLSKEFAR